MGTRVIMLLAALFIQAPGKLEIRDTLVGKGLEAKPGDILTVDYTGKLKDGKEPFDTSVGKKPFQFVLGAGQVIKGWDQGLIGMKVGGKRELTIPSDLGYGASGAGDEIPPNSTLHFDLSLVSVDRIESKILTPGKGEAAVKGGDTCELHYELKDDKGNTIDSSYDRKQTFNIVVGHQGLITGLTAGLIGMKQGEKRSFTVPAKFGFGDKGAGTQIKPGQTLYFTVEVVKLLSAEAK